MFGIAGKNGFATREHAGRHLVFERVPAEGDVAEVGGAAGEHVGRHHPELLGTESEGHRGLVGCRSDPPVHDGSDRTFLRRLPVASRDRERESTVDLGESIPGVEHAIPPSEAGVVGIDDAVVVPIRGRVVDEMGELVVDSRELLRRTVGERLVVDDPTVTVQIEGLEEEIEFVDELVAVQILESLGEGGSLHGMTRSESTVVVDVGIGDDRLEFVEFRIERRRQPADVASHVEWNAVAPVELAFDLSVTGPQRSDDQDVLADHDPIGTHHRVFDPLVQTHQHRQGPADLAVHPFAGDADRGFARHQFVPEPEVGGVLLGGDADRPHREQIAVGVDVGKRGVARLDDLAVIARQMGIPHGVREAGRIGVGDVAVGGDDDDLAIGRGVEGPVPDVGGVVRVDLALPDHESLGFALQDPGAVDEAGLGGAGRATHPEGDVGGPDVAGRHHGHRRGERAEDHQEHHGQHARDPAPSKACRGSPGFQVV